MNQAVELSIQIESQGLTTAWPSLLNALRCLSELSIAIHISSSLLSFVYFILQQLICVVGLIK